MVETKVVWWAAMMAEMMAEMMADLKVGPTAELMAVPTAHLMAEKSAVTTVDCWVGQWGSQTVGYWADSLEHQRVASLVGLLVDLLADKTVASWVESSAVLKAD